MTENPVQVTPPMIQQSAVVARAGFPIAAHASLTIVQSCAETPHEMIRGTISRKIILLSQGKMTLLIQNVIQWMTRSRFVSQVLVQIPTEEITCDRLKIKEPLSHS